jgi:hypothetical protein
MTATPERIAQLASAFRGGTIDEAEAYELRDALNARTGRPPLESADVLQDLATLLAAAPSSPSQASAPVPTGSAATSGNQPPLLAEYLRVQNDPRALAEFLKRNGPEVHGFLMRSESQAFAERQRRAVASGVKTTSDEDLLAEYQRVQGDPLALAAFLRANDAQIRAILDRPATT